MGNREFNFFLNHELRINKIVAWIFLGVCIVPIFIHIMVCLGYYNYPFNLSVIGVSVSLSLCLFIHLLNRIAKFSKSIKFIAIFAMQVPIFLYTLDVNTQVTVSYMLAVFFSLLYFNPIVTIYSCVLALISVIFSTIISAPQAVSIFWPGISPVQYIWTTGSGRVAELLSASTLFISLSILARNLMNSLHQRNERIYSMQTQIVYSFADIIESRDGTTGEHVKRTSQVVSLIADYICRNQSLFNYNLSKHDYDLITMAAPLHDIGKMKVPDTILSKPGKLDQTEYEIIKTHSLEGAKIIDKIMPKIEDAEYVRFAREMALNHHEKWNGQGYPQGLEQEQIPISARIMAVADVFDALCSKRSYKLPYTIDEAFGILIDSKGSHFEPILVDVMIALRPKLEEIYN